MSTLRISEKNWRSFLLDYRMAALGLDPIEIAAIVPQTFNKLQCVCSSCERASCCLRDLAGDAGDAAWKDYCPNAVDLLMVDPSCFRRRVRVVDIRRRSNPVEEFQL